MVVIVRYGEIALKGKNRSMFEKRLVRNMKDCLNKNDVEYEKIERLRGRIVIYTEDDCDCLSNVFGITSYSKASIIEPDLEKIKEESVKYYSRGTFRISSKRLDKILVPSNEIEREVGAYVFEHTGAKVRLKGPDTDIGIDIFKDRVFIFSEKKEGLRGLPVGVEGVVAVLLEDDDSVEAAKLMMKRGCEIILIKVNDINYNKLKEYVYGFRLKVVDEVPKYIEVIVTSEKLNNLKDRETEKVILRPLVGK